MRHMTTSSPKIVFRCLMAGRPLPQAARPHARALVRVTLAVVAGCCLALAAMAMPARAASVADFYRGKTVTLFVGYGPGGGYDVIGRLVARHLGRHMPGAPAVVVQNMPGAGSLAAAN